jgi:hypothetical protein
MVNNSDREEMKKILEALNGKPKALSESKKTNTFDEIGGPGVVTSGEIDAMAKVLQRFNNVTSQVLTESKFDNQLNEAINTKRIDNNVKIGNYDITIKTDNERIAGKQYYSITNTKSGDIIASDITLYEIALQVIKQLNNGKFVNSSIVRKLFEMDDKYTSQKISTIQFKQRFISSKKNNNISKSEIYENRYQQCIRDLSVTKREIKKLIVESRREVKCQ